MNRCLEGLLNELAVKYGAMEKSARTITEYTA